MCAARLWGHSALETNRALSFDCQEAQGSPGCCEHEEWCQPLAQTVWSWQELDPSLPRGLEMGDVSFPCCLQSRELAWELLAVNPGESVVPGLCSHCPFLAKPLPLLTGDTGGAGGGAAGLLLCHPPLCLHSTDGQQVFPHLGVFWGSLCSRVAPGCREALGTQETPWPPLSWAWVSSWVSTWVHPPGLIPMEPLGEGCAWASLCRGLWHLLLPICSVGPWEDGGQSSPWVKVVRVCLTLFPLPQL